MATSSHSCKHRQKPKMPFSALPLEVILENIARQDGKERENKYRKAELEIPHFCR